MQLLGKLMGDPNKRDIKAIQPLVDKINAFEPAIQKLSDDELAAKTVEFRSQLFLHLKGGVVLEDELVKLFREALNAIEPYAQKSTNEQLHAAITEYRQTLERRRDPEQYLRDHLKDTLSECFETGYEYLSPALNSLRATAAMDKAEETQKWPDEAKDPQRATLSLLKDIEPALEEIDDDELAEAFQAAWPHFEEVRRNAPDKEEGADERLEHLLGEILQYLRTEIVAIKAEAMDKLVPEMVKRYRTGKTLDDLLPEACAVVREAGWRRIKMRHYDVQLIGGVGRHQGKIAEMRTGEGKTLVATLPAYLNALTGNGVHIVTVNDYLAQRDADWMGRVYRFLGLTVGVNLSQMSHADKQTAYAADITYGTNNEFGFDYLRDNMVFQGSDRVQRGLNYAIVDEVDSILIDEARTPLIISGQSEDNVELYYRLNEIAPRLTRQADEQGAGDYWVDEKAHQVLLSEQGHEHAENLLADAQLLEAGTSLYDAHNIALMHHLYAALRAHALYHRDQHYVVQNGEVVIVDEFTGRLMAGRRWSDGLHQAVEAKEGVPIQRENQTLASITFQNYFRMYQRLAGMTGTADTEAFEFQQIYHLETVVIPTNLPMIRADENDQVFRTFQEKVDAITGDIKDCYERRQPVVVGTTSIENSELLSGYLDKEKLPHQVLNAKQHAREAEIIAQAGRPGVITIATNMAGRGTDIVLGGAIEPQILKMREDEALPPGEKELQIGKLRAEWQLRHDAVIAAGGRHIVGTE